MSNELSYKANKRRRININIDEVAVNAEFDEMLKLFGSSRTNHRGCLLGSTGDDIEKQIIEVFPVSASG